ncbi:MAG: amidohydrolase [Clostridiales bacterium]|nr:amidohydrolase [Clostridiales bacterium]
MNKTIDTWIKEHAEVSAKLAEDIFNHPELAEEEVNSAGYLRKYMEDLGFSIEENAGGMPTAFTATWGSGKPVIGFLAEYDALPGLGQDPVPYRSERKGPGHGCGHNLLGAGCAAAAGALKAAMEKENLPGTIIFFGCPAEETLVGKVRMGKAGCFDDVDVAIAWHPVGVNKVSEERQQAMDSKIYRFYGKTAHAAASPEMGRSALDAAELMNVGVNYLREHVPDHVRMHYSYDSAGEKPNIVPDFAQLSYFIRARDRATVDDVSARVDKIAEGAALMTGTRMEMELLTGCDDTLVNETLCRFMMEAFQDVPAPVYTEEEKAFATELRKNVEGDAHAGEPPLREWIEPLNGHPEPAFGSTDVANVSRIVPTVTLNAVATFNGSPGHHWAVTAVSGMSIGFKGMLYGAQAMAEGAYRLLLHPEVVEAAKKDFAENSGK